MNGKTTLCQMSTCHACSDRAGKCCIVDACVIVNAPCDRVTTCMATERLARSGHLRVNLSSGSALQSVSPPSAWE